MKTFISVITLIFMAFSGIARSQITSPEEAFALAKASGRSMFVLGGQES